MSSYDVEVSDALRRELADIGVSMAKRADGIVLDYVKQTFIPKLKARSPSSPGEHENKYRDGWRVKTKTVKRDGKDVKIRYVSNGNRPELTRIWEFGYEKVLKSGRVFVAHPIPHIRVTIAEGIPELETKLQNEILN